MPTTKKPTKPSAPKKAVKATPKAKSSKPAIKEEYTDEYRDYLDRYQVMGEGRPRLKPKEFDKLDDEFLDLIETQFVEGLDDDQTIRLKELEFLLLESES